MAYRRPSAITHAQLHCRAWRRAHNHPAAPRSPSVQDRGLQHRPWWT